MDTPSAPPAWIAPGAVATLVWYEGAVDRADGARMFQVAGPALEGPLSGSFFLLCPVSEAPFADRLYQDQATTADLTAFLARSTLVRGELTAGSEWLAARAETPLLPVLEAWDRLPERPLVPYAREIAAFLPGDALLHVSPEAHAEAGEAIERFATAWVCEECGQADDAAVFLWTRRLGDRVRVRLLIENQAGLWTCHIHPFEFAREAA